MINPGHKSIRVLEYLWTDGLANSWWKFDWVWLQSEEIVLNEQDFY